LSPSLSLSLCLSLSLTCTHRKTHVTQEIFGGDRHIY
jgi:hypothetical protein